MFDGRKYFEKENAAIDREYRDSVRAIAGLVKEEFAFLPDPWREFFLRNGRFLLELCVYEEKIGPEYFLSAPIGRLIEENNAFFRELEPEAYERSYANPAFCAGVFELELGRFMSCFHVQLRQHIRYAFRHERFEMEESHRRFLDAAACLKEPAPDLTRLQDILTARHTKDRTAEEIRGLRERIGPAFDLAERDDGVFPPDDPRYLFLSGSRVSLIEINTARFINNLPQKDINAIARTVAGAFARGFVVDNKDRAGKTVCSIWGSLGQERIYQGLIRFLKDEGFTGVLKILFTPPLNRQYWFDHQFDAALYLTPELADQWEAAHGSALEACRDLYPAFSGSIYFETFGEKPFSPKMKNENARFSEDQQRLFAAVQRRLNDLHERYLPRAKASFSAVAFPSTEIGGRFEEIFREMIAVNTLDPDTYAGIQQAMIDVLDAATSVRITGRSGNNTDLTVRLRPLEQPATQTNFVNCGADINIPVGEVFTSPRLAGTNGTLHVSENYLFGYFFKDLTLVFQDGMITAYGCSNHPTMEENKRYIEENLLFPHQTLPLGEFAIGTNTRAFAMSRRFNLLDRLPVLLIEKMGPHFAIGDTCFAREEDHAVYNLLNKKEIVARDNEKSIMRKTDPENAYTHKHIDITLPFGEIGRLSAAGADGRETDIIKDGVFVLPGTEPLNEPLRGLEEK